jgi:hypothetical protein
LRLNVCHKAKPCAYQTFLGLRVNGVMVTSCKAVRTKTQRQRQYTKPLRLAERICQITVSGLLISLGQQARCCAIVTALTHSSLGSRVGPRFHLQWDCPALRAGAPFSRRRNAPRRAGLLSQFRPSQRAASVASQIGCKRARKRSLWKPARRTRILRQSCGTMHPNMWIIRLLAPRNATNC